jgi:hypothetical protein
MLYFNRNRSIRKITTYVISVYHHYNCEFEPRSGEAYLIQHYVIKFVGDMGQVSGFLRVLQFPVPIKLIVTLKNVWVELGVLIKLVPNSSGAVVVIIVWQLHFWIYDYL